MKRIAAAFGRLLAFAPGAFAAEQAAPITPIGAPIGATLTAQDRASEWRRNGLRPIVFPIILVGMGVEPPKVGLVKTQMAAVDLLGA
jgi:hypothetical protein